MTDVVLVLAGQIGAGKSSSARYLAERYEAQHLSFVAEIWLPILEERGLEPTRHNLQVLGIELMGELGPEGLVDRLLDRVLKGQDYVIDDVRSPGVYDYLRSRVASAKLIFLEAPIGDRFPRLKIRDGVESLAEQEAAERVETETAIDALAGSADFRVRNTGSLSELHRALDEVAVRAGLTSR